MAVFLAILGIALYILIGISVLYFTTLYELTTDEEDYEDDTEAYAFVTIVAWPVFLVLYTIAILIDLCNALEKNIAESIRNRIHKGPYG
jgi:NADH:ubiquinone oxidoreductase subunit 6 (subunit J)